MKFWAIRDKATGYFMPSYPSRKGRGGYTNDEPEKDCVPRLFRLKGHADLALRNWKNGVTKVSYEFGGPDGDCDEKWSVEPKHNRALMDMEIAAVSIIVN